MFIYFEELDWILRAKGRFKLGWAPSSIIYHREGGSIGTSANSLPSKSSIYFMARAKMIFLSLNYKIGIPFALVGIIMQAARFIIYGRPDYAVRILVAIIQSKFWNVKRSENMLYAFAESQNE